jgi:hypothetical protein
VSESGVFVCLWEEWICNRDSNACPRHVLCPLKNMPTCFLPLQTSGHDLGTVADGCDGPVDKQRSAVQEDSEARCGWCFFRPLFLQRFRTAKWVLFWLCWAGAVQGRKESLHYYYYYYYLYISYLQLHNWNHFSTILEPFCSYIMWQILA